MDFRLVDVGWAKVLDDALNTANPTLRIVCPFIKKRTAERLLKTGRPKLFQVITRFNLCDFASGVSDTSALRVLLDSGAQVRGVINLHAKLYLFNENRVIVTSANLTEAALFRNHEFGFVAEDAAIVERCREYFADLWNRAGQDLQTTQLANWEHRITSWLAGGARPGAASGLEMRAKPQVFVTLLR